MSPDKKLLWAERQRQLGARQLSRLKAVRTRDRAVTKLKRLGQSELPGFLLEKRWVSAPVFAQMGQVSGEVARNLFFQTAQVSKKVARNSQSGQSEAKCVPRKKSSSGQSAPPGLSSVAMGSALAWCAAPKQTAPPTSASTAAKPPPTAQEARLCIMIRAPSSYW